jgi:hypothetical protein
VRASCFVADGVRAACALLVFAGTAACAPEPSHPLVGEASGVFACEIFLPGTNPPNSGDGEVTVTLRDEERVLAQSAAAFAVDGQGSQTLDPANAIYFAVQIFQFVTETELEIFEVRVLPEDWTDGAVLPVDGETVVAFFGSVTFDANGNATDARITAASNDGELVLESAGRNPRESVTGSFAVELSND